MTLYVGLMSGTSMDGIDAVLLEVAPAGMRFHAASHRAWTPSLQQRLRRAAEQGAQIGLVEFGELDTLVGREFALAAEQLLRDSGTDVSAVRAIGSHGQTVLHQPRNAAPFTLQIGDPNVIAEQLGTDVVADFRRRDVAAGGEGAPLMPAFHQAAFAVPGQCHAVANIGGIANVSLLRADGTVIGFDTGPGNCLLDAWSRMRRGRPYDENGSWAASGQINAALLQRMLSDPYFQRPAPKSTGRETFSDAWLARALTGCSITDADVQATLCELTARTIADAVAHAVADADAGADTGVAPKQPPRGVWVCGGGAANVTLMNRLQAASGATPVQSTEVRGIDPQHVEAGGFAWLAHRYLSGQPGNIPTVTGARHAVPLGALYRGK